MAKFSKSTNTAINGTSDMSLLILKVHRCGAAEEYVLLVGLDIVGRELMKINPFSPGGLGSGQKPGCIDPADAVLDVMKRKSPYLGFYEQISLAADKCDVHRRGFMV